MTVRVGINGFGRIGRNFYRALLASGADVEVVGVNDLTDITTLAHLLKYDSILGRLGQDVVTGDDSITVGGDSFKVLAERDPRPCRGRSSAPTSSSSRPATSPTRPRPAPTSTPAPARSSSRPRRRTRTSRSSWASTSDQYDSAPRHHLQRLVHDELPRADGEGALRGVRHRQGPHDDDPRLHNDQVSSTSRTRTCAAPAPPPSTSSRRRPAPRRRSRLVIPELKGKLDGFAMRVPVPTGSATDLTVQLEREVTKDEVNAAFKRAAEGSLKGYLEYTEDPIVSTDIVTARRPASSTPGSPWPRATRSRSSAGTTTSGATRTASWTSPRSSAPRSEPSHRLTRVPPGPLRRCALVGRDSVHSVAGRPPAHPGAKAMKTIDDLGDLRGKRVLVRSDLNVPLDGTTITDDGRIRAPCRRSRGSPTPAPASSSSPTSAARRACRRSAYTLRPVAARLSELLGREVRFAVDTVGPPPRGSSRSSRTATSRCWRTSASTPAETSKDDAERGAFAEQLAAFADAYVSDGFGVVHRKQASVYDVAAAAAARRRRPGARRGRGPAPAHRRPGAAVRRRPRRVEGVRQARRHREPADVADRLLIGGGMVFTFLAAQGHEVGSSLLEDGPDRHGRGLPRDAPQQRGVEVVLPVDVVVADAFAADAAHDVVPADAMPAGRMGLDIGPESARAVRRRSWPTPGRCSGTARWACSSSRRSPRAPGRSPRRSRDVDGAHRRRRRRLRGRRPTPRLRRDGVRAHLHRWRRLAGVPRGQDAPGHRGAGGLSDEPRRTPLMAGNWKMNLDHQQATHFVQKLAWTLEDAKHDYERVEVAVLPPFTDIRSVQTLIDGDKLGSRYGAQDLSQHDVGAYTGEISGAFLAKLGCTYVVVGHSERRAVPRRGRRAGQRQGEGGAPARADPDPLHRRAARRPACRRATCRTLRQPARTAPSTA